MKRYTVSFTQRPGRGKYDHRYEEFIACLMGMLKPSYLRRHTLAAAIARNTPEARDTSGFDGDFTYRATYQEV